jgi:hypothetical protein
MVACVVPFGHGHLAASAYLCLRVINTGEMFGLSRATSTDRHDNGDAQGRQHDWSHPGLTRAACSMR